jgi:hypothetical protein
MPGVLPRALRLSDGGIYNNLGYDWFKVLNEQLQGTPNTLWPFGELPVADELRAADELRIEEATDVIIVNAGAPSKMVRSLPSLIPFIRLARVMSVLYDNTVQPRLELIRAGGRPLIDIQETPKELGDRLAKTPGEVAERAMRIIDKLKSREDKFWAALSEDTAGTTTKLTPAGPRTAARVMLHGYLSGLVLSHAQFGGSLPARIRGEAYFLKLVDRDPSSSAKNPPETTAAESPNHQDVAA